MVLFISFLEVIARPVGLACLAAIILLAGYWVERLRWAAVVLMTVITLFLLAGVIPDLHGLLGVEQNHSDGVKGLFQSSFFMFLGAVLSIAMLCACWRRRLAASQIPFWVAHAGIVLVLGGAAVDHFWGDTRQLVMWLHEPPAKQFQSRDKMDSTGMGSGMADMPFMMRLNHLEIFSYNPKIYRVYRSKPTADGRGEFKFAGEVVPQLETMKDREEKPVKIWVVSLAKIPGLSKEWTEEKIPVGQLVPDKGSLLIREMPMGELALECDTPPDKTIEVKIDFGEGKDTQTIDLTVNHPAVYKGWRFYMMDYDPRKFQWALITARHDPGRGAVIAGLWLVILGMAGLCFWRRRGSEPPPRPGPSQAIPVAGLDRQGEGQRRHRPRRRSGSSGRGPTPPPPMTPREGGN